jgi:hypothetical protein
MEFAHLREFVKSARCNMIEVSCCDGPNRAGVALPLAEDGNIRRMASSGMLRRVALVRTDVSEELSASIRVTRIGELGTTIAVTSNRRTLQRNNKNHTA